MATASAAVELASILHAARYACGAGKSGKFEAASARIHHLGSPSSALVLSVHS